MPAEMLLNLARMAYAKAVKASDDTGELEIVDLSMAELAGSWGGQAAPYFHARLQAVESKVKDVGSVKEAVDRAEQARRRVEEERKKREAAEAASAPPSRAIVGGDLNAGPGAGRAH